METIFGIDMGGTKIEGAVLRSADSPDVLVRKRVPTEAKHGYAHVLQQVKKLVDAIAEETGQYPKTLGIGTPGTIDVQTQLLKGSNSVVLNGKPFKRDLEQVLGIPIKVANDANCFALAEARMGIVPEVVPDASVVFGVIMGTGVGGGIVVNNQVLFGRHGIAGEWGHSYLDDSGGSCYCGNVGCVETVLSGPSLERYYKEISGTALGLKDIYTNYADKLGDEFSNRTIERLLHFFGKAIANIINTLDPDVIVIGGGVGNIPVLYEAGVKEVEKYTFNPTLTTPILKPKLGDSAGVFGAAFLVS